MEESVINPQVEQFSKELYSFLWSDEVLALTPEYGWLDGGCRSLLSAFTLWLGEAVHPYQLVKSLDQHHSEHVVAKVGHYYLDGDGVSLADQLMERWIEEEGFPTVILRPLELSLEPSYDDEEPTYLPDSSIRQLAILLQACFNREQVLQLLTTYEED